jgi:hypothetical protein
MKNHLFPYKVTKSSQHLVFLRIFKAKPLANKDTTLRMMSYPFPCILANKNKKKRSALRTHMVLAYLVTSKA